jgi:hypothetical protein
MIVGRPGQGLPTLKKGEIHKPLEKECSTWNVLPNRQTYASFGDQGLTASVNDYGDIIQFGRYLGAGDSGMFSADHKSVEEPYLVKERAETLQSLCKDRGTISYGMIFSDTLDLKRPSMKYVHDRWPRYEYQTAKAEIAIQWMVHEKTVVQQCVVTAPD